jgi:hypothetical protein
MCDYEVVDSLRNNPLLFDVNIYAVRAKMGI